MIPEANRTRSAFSWNAGGWFGSQLGCTLWLLLLGLVLFRKDSLSAWVCSGGFVALNAWGGCLWRQREHLAAYAGFQRFLLAVSVLVAVVVVVVHARGVAEPPAPGALVSTYVPYWAMAVSPSLALVFFWRERMVARGQR